MRPKTLTGTSSAVAVTAIVGSIASRDVDSDWYRRIDKPAFQPPAIAFPVVWTALYADIAATSADVIDTFQDSGRVAERASYQRALGLNLVLNGSWTWMFFRLHKLGPATVLAGALAASSADLSRRARSASPRAGALLAPYAAWCGFATVLSGAILRRNR